MRLVSDHCHASGLSRDLLCRPCNLGLGHFSDDPMRLRAAAVYIEAHRDAAPAALLELTKAHAADRLASALRLLAQQAADAKEKAARQAERNKPRRLPVAPRLAADPATKQWRHR